jgi:protein TonB
MERRADRPMWVSGPICSAECIRLRSSSYAVTGSAKCRGDKGRALNRFHIPNSIFQKGRGAIALSVAAHMAALFCLGVSYSPEPARQAGPMVMWLANFEQEPGARSQEPGGGAKPTYPEKLIEKVPELAVETVKSSESPIKAAMKKPPEIKTLQDQDRIISKVSDSIPVEEQTRKEDKLEQARLPVEQDYIGSEVIPAQNPKLRTQNSTNAMLAFVGDPVAAGIIPMTEGDNILVAKILSLPEPVYPTLSRRRGEEGRVVIKIRVSAQGAVRGAQIETSSSYPRLDRAALEAVHMAQFSPALEYGRQVESERIVAYRFELEGK